MIKIWHANTRESRFNDQWPVNFPDNYQEICTLDVPYNLDDIYDYCNNKPWDEIPWYEQADVTLAKGINGARSLSAGDLIQIGDILIRVMGVGFELVKY